MVAPAARAWCHGGMPRRPAPVPPSAARARGRRAPAALALAAALLLAPGSLLSAEPEGSMACAVPAFLLDDDPSLLSAYDGLRRGLEDAHLPRVCIRRVESDDDAGWSKALATVAAERPAFVVAFGRRAGARVAAGPLPGASGRIPCVYVDAAGSVAGRALPAIPDPPAPCAVVRAEPAFEGFGRVLRGLFPGRPQPTVVLPWTAESPEAATWRRAAAAAAGLELRLGTEGTAGADAFLDWSPGLGETALPFEDMLREARALRLPLLSADRNRFGRGAAVVHVPDFALLGRVAADACRRLGAGEGAGRPLRIAVLATETRVDLEAADAEGLVPPLPFLASADRLRRAPPGPAPLPPRRPAPR